MLLFPGSVKGKLTYDRPNQETQISHSLKTLNPNSLILINRVAGIFLSFKIILEKYLIEKPVKLTFYHFKLYNLGYSRYTN